MGILNKIKKMFKPEESAKKKKNKNNTVLVVAERTGKSYEETDIILTSAVDRFGGVHDVHPNTGHIIKGFQIPNFDKVKELALKAADGDFKFNYVGWDIAVCNDKAVLIEGNSRPCTAAYQIPFAQESFRKRMQYKFQPYLN